MSPTSDPRGNGARPARRRSPELICVIVPVRNEERHIGAQLQALSGQTYRGAWELLIVDNGCTDRTIGIAREWVPRLPSLRIVDARAKRGLSYARNVAAATARGDLLAFCDGDDVVAPGWLAAIAAGAAAGDLVGGPLDFEPLNEPLLKTWCPDVREDALPVAHDFLPYVPGGNFGVWTAIARELGWDERFTYGSDDQAFSWRAQLAGYRLVYAPEAVVYLRYCDRLRDLAAQYFSYGRSGPLLYRVFEDLGMPRPSRAEAIERWRWLARRVPRDLRSPGPRGNWIRVAAFSSGGLVGELRSRRAPR